jgi:hypothetical protein|tara:strand:+ start:326 stop:559 length:234 start_codon:yes stop_codon:yes gene_type:complete
MYLSPMSITIRIAPQPVKDTPEFSHIISSEVRLLEFEKCASRQKAVAASLVLRSNPHDVELLSEFAESSMQIISELH